MFINVKSLIFRSNFGLVLILFLIISAQFLPILCQTKKVAIVSITTQNGNFDRATLEQITSLLNNEVDLNDAIFFDNGEISSLSELTELQAYISNLKIQFNILPGFNDYSNHVNYSSIFTQVFDSEDFVIDNFNSLIIGFNSIISGQNNTGFIKRETLNLISENLPNHQFNSVYLFSNNPISKVQNNYDLFDMLKEKYVFSIYNVENKFSVSINSENNIIEIGIPSASLKDNSSLYILEEKSDSLFIERKLYKNQIPEILFRAASKDFKKLNINPQKQIISPELKCIFEEDFKGTSTTTMLTSNNKFYSILDNGLIHSKDFSGKEKFVTEVIGSINKNSVLYKDLLLVATYEGDLYSINSNNGEILQVVGIGEAITSDLALVDIGNIKAVTFGTSEGNIFCYDAFTFEVLWKKNICTSPIISTPAVDKDRITYINSKSSLYSINSKSGVLNWQNQFNKNENFSSTNFPLSDGKKIISLSPDGNLLALDLLLGKIIWSINSSSIKTLFLSSDKKRIFTMNNVGIITIVSTKDGKEISKLDLKKSGIFSFVIAENQERTLIGLTDGSLYSLDHNFNIRELITQNQIPITSINVIGKNEFIIKDINGKIKIYKIN